MSRPISETIIAAKGQIVDAKPSKGRNVPRERKVDDRTTFSGREIKVTDIDRRNNWRFVTIPLDNEEGNWTRYNAHYIGNDGFSAFITTSLAKPEETELTVSQKNPRYNLYKTEGAYDHSGELKSLKIHLTSRDSEENLFDFDALERDPEEVFDELLGKVHALSSEKRVHVQKSAHDRLTYCKNEFMSIAQQGGGNTNEIESAVSYLQTQYVPHLLELLLTSARQRQLPQLQEHIDALQSVGMQERLTAEVLDDLVHLGKNGVQILKTIAGQADMPYDNETAISVLNRFPSQITPFDKSDLYEPLLLGRLSPTDVAVIGFASQFDFGVLHAITATRNDVTYELNKHVEHYLTLARDASGVFYATVTANRRDGYASSNESPVGAPIAVAETGVTHLQVDGQDIIIDRKNGRTKLVAQENGQVERVVDVRNTVNMQEIAHLGFSVRRSRVKIRKVEKMVDMKEWTRPR